jgi:hypothetical protein
LRKDVGGQQPGTAGNAGFYRFHQVQWDPHALTITEAATIAGVTLGSVAQAVVVFAIYLFPI